MKSKWVLVILNIFPSKNSALNPSIYLNPNF